jgi:hypothetical protein
VDVWLVRVSPRQCAEAERSAHLLGPDVVRRLDRGVHPGLRPRVLLAEVTLRLLPAACAGLPPRQVRPLRERCAECRVRHGRQLLPDMPGLLFSTDHTGETVVCALAAAPVFFSVVAGVVAASVADLGLGAFPGRLWQVAGVAALLSFATVATIAALHRLLGLLAFPLSTLLLLQLGIATSGGPVPRDFLPSFYRALSPGMPGAAEVQAVRRLAYLHQAPVASSLLVLTAWAVPGTLITLLAWRLRPAPAARPAS